MTPHSSPLSKLFCRSLGTAFDVVRRGFPPIVRLETTNACNARCTICPHRQMKRPIMTMDDSLYRRLIDECAAARCREVHLHNFGEPLLDKKLDDRIAYAKRKGLRRVRIFCNGSLLNAERARQLIEAGLDEIKVSFDGASREEFEQIRTPLRFDTVVQNVLETVKARNSMRSNMKIRVACCSTTDKAATMQLLENAVDKFAFGKLHNWAGETTPRESLRKPCSRLWRTFTVLAGGEVALCCLDYDGQELLGSVHGDSIRGIWNGNRYRELRRRHREARQSEIPLCAGCTKAFL